jgi:hypothetical protein
MYLEDTQFQNSDYLINFNSSLAVCGKRPTDTGDFINFIAYICRSLGHW